MLLYLNKCKEGHLSTGEGAIWERNNFAPFLYEENHKVNVRRESLILACLLTNIETININIYNDTFYGTYLRFEMQMMRNVRCAEIYKPNVLELSRILACLLIYIYIHKNNTYIYDNKTLYKPLNIFSGNTAPHTRESSRESSVWQSNALPLRHHVLVIPAYCSSQNI